MKIRLLSLALALVSMPVWGQNDEAASAQHLILGQQASGATQLQSLTNTHPDAQWFPKAGFGLFIHLGMSAVHGGIDLSWGMLKINRGKMEKYLRWNIGSWLIAGIP